MCFWNIYHHLDVSGRNVISSGKGSQTEMWSERLLQNGREQGGCHIYVVMGDKPFEIKVMALYRRSLKTSHHV